MNGDVAGMLTTESRSTALAFASIAVWFAAAAMTGPLGIWTSIGGAAVALGVAVLLLDRPAPTALLHPTSRLVLLGVVAGTLMAAATYLLYPALALLVPSVATDTALLYAAFRAPSPAVASMGLVPIIIGEEVVWRGVVQMSLVRHFGVWTGVTLAATVYALVHAPVGSSLLVVVAFFCGLAWGALRATTASLVPTLVAHMLWDVLVLLWLPLDAR
jgi:membrane protease YdiL (CAAX protease family)